MVVVGERRAECGPQPCACSELNREVSGGMCMLDTGRPRRTAGGLSHGGEATKGEEEEGVIPEDSGLTLGE